ncbi:hypothetical protein [Blastopirellula marina]|uniref:Uncharacterized protein n=1 Tax=Blastopirellula marina TaxID=124 RepID=A0A2S8GCR1_9BACT|nr:hypothetical protein [Blastopirellula marina]PQO42248.1 hypothetical protein C5Y93_28290 [Blastopirellula marina]
MLTNGNAMQGRITHEGEYYVLAINDNSVIRMPAARVAFACKSMEEAYLRQRARVGTATLRDHIELANWCLGLDLWEEATYHHTIAMRSGPNDPAVIRLDRRYQVKQEERSTPPELRRVEFTQPVPPSVPELVEDPVAPEASVSPQLMQYYASTIQPIMLNGCSVSACHSQTAENGFHLVQFENIRSIPRRLTIKNMNSALPFIDFADPGHSKLLIKSATPHGEGAGPSLSREQISAIQAWVYGVSREQDPVGRKQVANVMPVSFDAPATSQAEELPVAFKGLTPPAKPATNPFFSDGGANVGASGIARPIRSMPQKGAPIPEPPKVRDEFDPELFNRQHHPNRQVQLFPE